MFDLKDLIFENRKLNKKIETLDKRINDVIQLIDSEELVPSPTVKLMKIKVLLEELKDKE